MGLIAVVRKNQPISTTSLAAALKLNPKKVYRDCRKLEIKGLLRSTFEKGRKLLFCVDHEVVITAENYDDHKGHNLKGFYGKVKVWSLT